MKRVLFALLMVSVTGGFAAAQATQPATATSPRSEFRNEFTWPDTSGVHINAHGGSVLLHEGTYYWIGESRNPREPGLPWTRGIQCYSSKDLYNWTDEGLILKVEDDPNSDIASGCAIERPKVIFNARTGKFVMWFHLELKGRRYAAARTALAIGDRPNAPFKFVKSLRPNAGKWPIEFPEDKRTPLDRDQVRELMRGEAFRKNLVEGAYTRRDFEGGQMARDMTLFVDDDGKAYHIASAEENYTLNIHELTDDYTEFTGKWTRVVPGGHNEAPALIKRNGKYLMLASGCTGWDPNPARVLQADSIWGPWKNVGNPCSGVNAANGMGPEKTFGGQSTAIFPVPGKRDAYIAMFDIWRSGNIIESGHIWLPVRFDGDRMVIEWRETWDLSVFN